MKRLLIHLSFVLICCASMNAQIQLPHTTFYIVGYGLYHTIGNVNDVPQAVWNIAENAAYNGITFTAAESVPDAIRGIDEIARSRGMISFVTLAPFYEIIGGDTVPTQGLDYVIRGRRTRYQLEYSAHFGGANRIGEAYMDGHHIDQDQDEILAAVKDADAYNQAPNCWRARTGFDSPGFIGRMEVPGEEQDTDTLHVRIRMRLPDYQNATPGDTVLIIRILIDQQTITRYITTDSTKRVPWNDGMGNRLRDDNMYGEVDCGFFVKPTPNEPYAIELEWTGKATTHIDYLAIDDAASYELFRGGSDGVIDDWQQEYGNSEGPFMIGTEEAITPRLTLIGYIEERSLKFPYQDIDRRVRTMGYNWEGQREWPLRYMLETRQAQYVTDIYPIWRKSTHSRPDSLAVPLKMANFQAHIDKEMSDCLRLAAEDINRYNPDHPLWYTAQLHSWADHNREPANDEIRMLVNIAMCYGAKGIQQFAVKAADACSTSRPHWFYDVDPNNPNDTTWRFEFIGLIDPCNVPRTVNDYEENKVEGVTALNQKLAVIGPHMLALRWQDTFSRHKEEDDFPNTPPQYGNFEPQFRLLDTLKITRLRTYDQQGRMDIFTDRYVEVGWLRNPTDTTEFIFVTNRRVLDNGGRKIVIGFNGTKNLAYKDMYSKNIDVISVNDDSLQVTLDPGDGTLLRIDSARWRRNEIVEETLTIHPKATLRIAPGYTLTVSDTGTVLIKDSATLVLEKGSNLAVNRGGRFLFEGPNSKLILAGDDTISGGGSIVNANIILRGDIRFRIPEGDTLKFQGGGKLECDEYYDPDSSRLVILGHVRFEDAGDEYHFGWCIDSIHVDDGTQQIVSIFETAPGVTLSFLPNLVSWQQGRMYGRGNTSDSSRWQFRNEANCDVYGHLIASHTIFEASPLDSIPSWDGILVAYESSLIQLDSCYMHQIRVHPSYGGSAIHFYQSLSFDNRINNCIIRSIAGQGYSKLGDAIFLQPGGTSSYVKITCCLIDQDWYSGVGALGSWFDLINTTVTDNNIGIGMNLDSHALLYSNAITGHIFSGVYVRHSFLRFGAFNGPGNNIITENDTTQISIDTASTVTGGMIGNPGNNEISHSSPSNRRVWVAPTAVVELRKNWWGVADSSGFSPDSCLLKKSTEDAFFSYANAQNFLYTYVLCDQPMIFIDCDNVYDNSILFLKQSNLPPYASSLQDLVRYAHEGNFAEVYRFVGNAIAQSSDPTRIITAANVALHLEVGHARRFPDSALTSRTRLTGFLQGRFNASSNALVKSGLLLLWSRALFALSAVAQSETKVNQLRSQFSSSPYAREALPLMQLIAMAKRDTLGMENAVTEMAQAGFNYTQMQQAYNMRRGYYRVLPRSLFQKASDEAERMVPELESNGQLVARAYPNPFNPSTKIEYAIPETTPVKLRVFDLLGREVARLVDGWQQEGTYAEVFDASHLPSGVYVYVLSTPYSHVSGRLLLAK